MLFLSEIVPISVAQTVFVIIARRREVEEEPSARAHLLFPLTPSDREIQKVQIPREEKKERDKDIRSLALSLSLGTVVAASKSTPLFARTHTTTAF